jgi:hypothetical protein
MKKLKAAIQILSNRLSKQERDKLSDSEFALPGRRYPIHDKQHAVAALWLVAINGTDEEKAIVRKVVKTKVSQYNTKGAALKKLLILIPIIAVVEYIIFGLMVDHGIIR